MWLPSRLLPLPHLGAAALVPALGLLILLCAPAGGAHPAAVVVVVAARVGRLLVLLCSRCGAVGHFLRFIFADILCDKLLRII